MDLSEFVTQEEKVRHLMATRLRRYRVDAGLSQQEVADRLGVSKMTVSKWETANDPGDRWGELAVLFDVRELLPGAPFNPAKRRAWLDARSARFASVGAVDAPGRSVKKVA